MAPRRSGRGRTQQHQSNIAHPNAHKDDQHPSSSSSSSNIMYNKLVQGALFKTDIRLVLTLTLSPVHKIERSQTM